MSPLQGARMYDLELIRGRVDLRALAEEAGAEFRGNSACCPLHHGDNPTAFHLYENGLRWHCFTRCPEGENDGDALAFYMLWKGIDFKTAAQELAERAGSDGHLVSKRPQEWRPIPKPPYEAPPSDWQVQARRAIEVCELNLWGNGKSAALGYLRDRGLSDDTIKSFRLGYSPGARFGALGIPRGIVIPCMARKVWYLKVRLLPGEPIRCIRCRADMPGPGICPKCRAKNKYRGVRGNQPVAIFNSDDLRSFPTALFLEGEFDAMIAWQALGGMMAVCTLGSVSNHRPDLATWGPYLLGLNLIMACFDNDPAGARGLANLVLLSSKVKLAPLPEGNWKDVNDYFLAGQDLLGWILPYLQAYSSPVCTEWPESDLESMEHIK